jgi:predicted amidohydrolase YtcJ
LSIKPNKSRLSQVLKVVYFLTLKTWLFIFNAPGQSPTLVIFNADIRTMDAKQPMAQAIAITGNKISAVGTNAQIKRSIGENTRTLDAGGRLVIPGFNDSHVHFLAVGGRFFSLDLKAAKSSEEILDKLRFYTKFLPYGKWIQGGFQTEEEYPLKLMPPKELVDSVTPNHPVLLYLKGTQMAFANSLALKLAGLEKFSPEARTSGILHEAEIKQVKKIIPLNPNNDSLTMLETATNYAASVGVTSVQDVHADDSFEIYRELEKQGKLKNRVYDCISLLNWQKLAARHIQHATGDSMIRQGCLKFFSDGDPEEIPDLLKLMLAADQAELQVMMHAIGARANEVVLTVFEKVRQQNGEKDRRFRIEHAHNFRPPDLRRFITSKTIASMQPALFFDRSGNDSRLFRKMLDAKTILSFGSDASMIDLNPLLGIYAAVYGRNPNLGMTVQEAVYAYTQGSAYAEFQENIKGSITVGKLADLVILSDNIFMVNPDQIGKVRVLRTIMDGKVVFENK